MSIKEWSNKWQLYLPSFEKISSLQISLETARKDVENLFSNVQPKQPPKSDLNHVYITIQNHFSSKQKIEDLNSDSLKKAPWILFTYPEISPGLLGRDSKFSKLYINWIYKRRKIRTASTLFFVFLKEYPTDISTFSLWRRGIEALFDRLDHSRIRLLSARCKNYHLLDQNGPIKFNDIFVNFNNDPQEIYNKAGLTGQLEKGGFSKAAYKDFLKRIMITLSDGKPHHGLLQKFFSSSVVKHEDGNDLRFETESKSIANSLLLPYADNNAHQIHSNDIQNFLLQHLGDPRIKTTGWVGVENRAKEVMYGWLVGATLDVFFKILDATADEIWTYRRAFWGAYYKKKVIQNAWAVLGKDATYMGKRINDSKLQFGRLSGAYTRNQSVLLMQIGDFVIAEWSHNGKCRIWRKDDNNQKNIPKLDNPKPSYDASFLREDADFEQVHYASNRGTWQTKIESFIRRYTNIKVFHSEYMP